VSPLERELQQRTHAVICTIHDVVDKKLHHHDGDMTRSTGSVK
jgi:hypothetical protein